MKPTKMRNKKIYRAMNQTVSRQICATLSKDLRKKYPRRSARIMVDDTVKVIRCEYKGLTGKVGIISTERNEELMAKGLIKDLARRLQALRKERGYNPTDVLNTASILDLDEESLSMIKNKTEELSFLVRVKQVNFTQTCKKYKDDDIDGQKIRISVE